MLDKILENKTKTNLMAFFLANPERNFYLGELQKRLSSSTLGTHLAALAKENILILSVYRGKKYFRINSKHELYPKLKDSFKKKFKKYEDEVVRYLKKLPGLKLAVLTGIFTSQNQPQCDILLVGNLPDGKVRAFEKGIDKVMGQEVDYAVFDLKEYEMRKNMFDRFMKDIFENEHIILINKIK